MSGVYSLVSLKMIHGICRNNLLKIMFIEESIDWYSYEPEPYKNKFYLLIFVLGKNKIKHTIEA